MSAAGAAVPDGASPNRAARRAAERRGRKLAALGSSAVLVSGAAGVAMSLTAGPALAAQTFTVDDSSDTGPTAADCTDVTVGNCSLRDAIAAANADAVEDLITFSITGTITLGSDLTGITEAVDIQGPGSGALTVDGGDDYNIFYFTGVDTGTPSISGLTIANGNSNGRNADVSGGAITVYESDATFSFDDVVVTSSYSEADGAGLLCAEGTANVTITGSTFDHNEAGDAGGGLYFDCNDLTIDSSTVNDNTADKRGGGLYFKGNTLTVSASTFEMNHAGSNGGGMWLNGNVHTISGTTLNQNSGSSGGAIYVNFGTLSLSDSKVTGNSSNAWGGGLYLSGDDVQIARSTFAGNQAGSAGGALEIFGMDAGDEVTVLASTFSGNSANDSGGAFYLSDDGTTLTLANSTIAGNTADTNGGGIAVVAGDLSLLQTTISGNTASTGLGDGVYFLGYQVPEPPLRAAQHAANKVANGEAEVGDVPVVPNVTAQEVGEVNITGTIVSGNVGGEDMEAGTDGPPVNVTANSSLFGGIGADITVVGGGNQTGVNNPGLGPLADNGGPTQTMALLSGSPAIDMGPTTVPSFSGNDTDQRQAGFPRVINGRVDIGAFEFQLVVRFTG